MLRKTALSLLLVIAGAVRHGDSVCYRRGSTSTGRRTHQIL